MSKAHHCPVCNSNNVDYGNLEFTSKFNTAIVAYGHCYDCEADFREHYKTDYQRSEVYEDNPWEGPAGAPVTYGTLEDLKKPKEPDPEMSMFEKIINEALDAAEAVSSDLRKRKHK